MPFVLIFIEHVHDDLPNKHTFTPRSLLALLGVGGKVNVLIGHWPWEVLRCIHTKARMLVPPPSPPTRLGVNESLPTSTS
jgi:hypothetical protein